MTFLDFNKFKTEKELKEFCTQLYNTNLLLQNKIEQLEESIKHTQDLLTNAPTLATEDDLEKLLMREIGYIDKLSKNGGLNTEESKQLKIMVDSYVALQRQKAGAPEPKKAKRLPNDPAKLIALVKGTSQ